MKYGRFAVYVLTAVLCLCMMTGCAPKTVTSTGTFGMQLEMPANGEEIAVMHTSHGDIYIRFFPEQAPKAVENFKTLSQEGYYDGLIFHRVIKDFMIQGGDPEGTGMGGQSCWGEPFADEFDTGLGNLRGALSMANAGANTNGSQFFINQATPETSMIAQAREYYKANQATYGNMTFIEFFAQQMSLNPDALTEEIVSVYEETGGNIHLDGPLSTSGTGHTVFGQVFKGMDVVDAIAAVETKNDMPLEYCAIKSIEWTTYNAE